jgi:hypothetical protein
VTYRLYRRIRAALRRARPRAGTLFPAPTVPSDAAPHRLDTGRPGPGSSR